MRNSTSSEVAQIVEKVRCFLKWCGPRFDSLDEMHVVIEQPLGWRRGGEWWVRPDIWLNDIFDGDAGDSEHAARVLRDLDFLRDQPPSLQITAKVRGVVKRVYAVDKAIFDWKPEVTRHGNKRHNSAGALLSVEEDTRLISPTNSSDPPNLAAKLQTAASQALDEALAILQLTPHRDDRVYSAVLRAKTAIIGSVLSTQVRVDEAMLRARREDVLAEHLKDCHSCAMATLGRKLEPEDIARILSGAYSRINKPEPEGLLEQLRAGKKPPKADPRVVRDDDCPFDA